VYLKPTIFEHVRAL